MSYYVINSSLNPIDQDQCIGDTLDTFNANFSALDVAVCNLSSTSIISGNVAYTTLSADVKSAIAKAWVVFDGTQTTPITPKASVNVSSVTKNSAGEYTINFTNSMPTSSYSVVAMCEYESNTPTVVQLNPSFLPTSSNFRLTICGGTNFIDSQTRGDYSYVTAVVYSK
jgi:hypothetical protein